jgi:hypothetical protein
MPGFRKGDRFDVTSRNRSLRAAKKGGSVSPDTARSNLEGLLQVVPKEVLADQARSTLAKLFSEMDQLLFLDGMNELSVDRKTLVRLVNNEAFIPKELRDVTLVETSKYLGRRIKEIGDSRRISWRDGEKYGMPTHPLTVQEISDMGVTEKTSTSELATILKKKFPTIPAFWMNDDPKKLQDSIVQQFQANRTVWDCIVANLGWWAALTLVGGLAIFIILVGSGVPWPWALLIAGIYQTGSTLYFLLQCVANPNFQQR